MKINGQISAVCISEAKGTAKKNIGSALLIAGHGIENDAHAGKWHRQVSLLSVEKVEDFKNRGGNVVDGDFGENLLVSGIDLRNLPIGTILEIGKARLKVTQIGKECHAHCEIFKQVGDCIMPREGIFAEVLVGGPVSAGDKIIAKSPYKAAILTASDKASEGLREDASGPLINQMLKNEGFEISDIAVLPDEKDLLKQQMEDWCIKNTCDLIVTTGGTGLSPRDCMPEATSDICERMVPGIAEAMRNHSLTITNRAMLSRGVCGICKQTLIINLPGSSKAVKESLEYILPVLDHALDTLKGSVSECASV